MTADISAALRRSKEGTIIDIEVQPGSSRPGKFSFDPWRKRLKLSVGARAEKGEANAELLSLLSRILDVPEARLSLLTGRTDRRKSVLVTGTDSDAILEKLTKMSTGE